jgi:UDP-glucose 4-epimerase
VAECDALIGQTINLGSGRETSVNQLATIIYEEAGVGSLAPNYQPRRPGDVQRHLADVRLAKELLGFHTKIDVRTGIQRLISHLRSQDRGIGTLLGETTALNWLPVGECLA